MPARGFASPRAIDGLCEPGADVGEGDPAPEHEVDRDSAIVGIETAQKFFRPAPTFFLPFGNILL